MKVIIKMNVPKPPRGMPGVTFFGHCYKWNNAFYEMGREYTIKKEDFNPAIMGDITPRKKPKSLKKEPIIIHAVDEGKGVELNLSDEVSFTVPENVEISTSDEIGVPTEETPVPVETSEKRKHRKK